MMKEEAVKEGMIKTNHRVCKNCIYCGKTVCGTQVICDYYMITGLHRDCPVGYCDKLLKGKKKMNNWRQKKKK